MIYNITQFNLRKINLTIIIKNPFIYTVKLPEMEELMKLKRIFFFILFFCLFTFSFLQAQDTWIQTYDPFYEAIFSVEDVIVCSDGGYAVNGTCIDLDTLIGWGFVMKTDSEGNMLWAKRDTVSFQIENESRAIVETEDGGILSASYLYIGGTAMIKRDASGIREWATLLEDFSVRSMDKTNYNNIIAAGYSRINNESWPTLATINQNAEIIWSQAYLFDNYDFGTVESVFQSSDDGYLLTGMLYNSNTYYDIFVIKTNASGDSLWSWIYDGYGSYDWSRKIIENSVGDIFVSGRFEAFNRIYYQFLLKLNGNGELIYLLNEEYSVNFYGCGRMVDTVIDNKIVGYGRIDNDVVLSAYDYDSENLWNTPVPLNSPASGDKSLQLVDDGFILAGFCDYDLALVKTDSNGNVVSINDEILPIDSNILSNYPNPFNPQTTIEFNIPYTSKILLQIYNIKGQFVKTLMNEEKQSGEHTIIWNAKDQSSGVYFVRFSNDKGFLDTHKIILLK